ncbi:hypothetical protein JCM15519_38590 [Fundidesulfovibrio butyratiphilus]
MLVDPDDTCADLLEKVSELTGFLAEAVPAWLDHGPGSPAPSPRAVAGLSWIALLLADMADQAAKRHRLETQRQAA